jgi:predicted nucleic acid-binding protein
MYVKEWPLHKSLALSFWYDLVVQAATSNCSLLLTGDLHDGLHAGDLIIKNPFPY